MMPLNYPSLLCVLPHLPANQRLGLIENCPSIRKTSNMFPIRVDNFEAKKFKITIHDKEYKVGIIRHYADGKPPPPWIRAKNEAGGVTYDVGAFGDPHLKKVRKREHRDREPEIEELIEKENAEAELIVLLPKSQWRNQNSQHREYEQVQMAKRVSELQKIIQNYNEQVAISELKFTEYIQLTITNIATETQSFKRFNYETPIENAMYCATKLLLDGKKIITQELTLKFEENPSLPNWLNIKTDRDFEMEIRDREVLSIRFPSHDAIFHNFSCLNVEFRRLYHRISFHVSEEYYNAAIQNVLRMVTENRRQRNRLDRRRFPVVFDYEAMGIGTGTITVDLRAEYRIEIFASAEPPEVREEREAREAREAAEQHERRRQRLRLIVDPFDIPLEIPFELPFEIPFEFRLDP